MDPTEWASWIYGRFFPDHPVIGFALIGGTIVVLFTLLLGFIWMRGVEKYNEQHPSSAQTTTREGIAPSPASPDVPKTEQGTTTERPSRQGIVLLDSPDAEVSDNVVRGEFDEHYHMEKSPRVRLKGNIAETSPKKQSPPSKEERR